ncbi:unnamed protein product [Calicophoron daubneyi]|uniref:Hexosyltransferase n=1 Tax=Calicophoron daubneyi TaxID=300641 RepID=A0AAV2TAH3_CALDB
MADTTGRNNVTFKSLRQESGHWSNCNICFCLDSEPMLKRRHIYQQFGLLFCRIRMHRRSLLYTIATFGVLYSIAYTCNLLGERMDEFTYPLNINLHELCEAALSNSDVVKRLPNPINPTEFGPLIVDPTLCSDTKKTTPDLLIFVKTTHERFEQREVIRRTWGRAECYKVNRIVSRVFFVLGTLAANSYTQVELQQEVLKEQTNYHDILQFDFIDSYRNNTYKLMASLIFAAEQCPHTRFIAIIDDDFLVHPLNLAQHLMNITKSQYPIYSAGHVYRASGPKRLPFTHLFCSVGRIGVFITARNFESWFS